LLGLERVSTEVLLGRFLEIGLEGPEARRAALERDGTAWLHELVAEICDVAPLSNASALDIAQWWGELRANYTQWNQHLMHATLALHEERNAELIQRFISECPWRPLVDAACDLLDDARTV
jgi:hypothetical protein